MSAPGDLGQQLAGHYQLHPGQVRAIVGGRPVLAPERLGRLLRGQRGEQVVRTLTSVFTLCAHAHRRSAELALGAARRGAEAANPVPGAGVLLALETAREHLRSMALDWPQRHGGLAADTTALAWLQGCPLPLATARPCDDAAQAWQQLADLRAWLEQTVLHQPARQWLDAHQPAAALAAWCQAQPERLLPARCLAAWYPLASTLCPPLRSLDLLDANPARQHANLQELARALSAEPDFCQRPNWRGACAETGPWLRLRHRGAAAPAAPLTAWSRLSARWLELLELACAQPRSACDPGAWLLASGALALGAGQALGWCEMARGLLLHWVALEPDGSVADYRVLAPTEWNFHPGGALARTLAALPADAGDAARTLAAAFDPCVACTL